MNTHNQIPEASLEEAMDWLIVMKDKPDCRETEAGFHRWLAATDINERAWRQALKTWSLLGETAPVFREQWTPSRPARARRPNGRIMAGAFAALAAVAILFLAGPALVLRLQADYLTTAGEHRTIVLDDGTRIDMGGNAAIAVTMNDAERHVDLLAGEAFFDVAHDSRRPFNVDAAGVSVNVLGTAFDVLLTDTETAVELARGSLAVSHTAPNRRDSFELAPGEMASINRSSGVAKRGTVDIKSIGAWREGRLFVNDVPLAAVAERIQRYHQAWITISDADLAARRVTGFYDLRNPDSALRALVQPFGGRVRAVTPYLRVLGGS